MDVASPTESRDLAPLGAGSVNAGAKRERTGSGQGSRLPREERGRLGKILYYFNRFAFTEEGGGGRGCIGGGDGKA